MAKNAAKKPAADDGPTGEYIATTYIEHDGEPYDAGDTLQLTRRQAAQLLEVGAVKPADAPAAPAAGDPSKTE